MSQISPPIRILLVCAIAFLAAWMLFLRPKAASAPAPAAATPAPNVQTGAPAQSFAGKMAQRAKNAVAKANGASAATDAATGSTSAATGATATQAAGPTLPAAALKALPKDVAAAVRARKVLVFGVVADHGNAWRPLADDDKAVRSALSHVNRYRGDVFVKRITLSQLAGYGPLLANLDVTQTPSVVIVDRRLRGTTIDGYLDRVSIDQAIVDARGVVIKAAFVRKLNTACARTNSLFDRLPWTPLPAERKTFAKRVSAFLNRRDDEFARIAAPARWRALKARWMRALSGRDAVVRREAKAIVAKDDQAYVAALQSFDFDGLRRLDREMNSLGAYACVSDRRS